MTSRLLVPIRSAFLHSSQALPIVGTLALLAVGTAQAQAPAPTADVEADTSMETTASPPPATPQAQAAPAVTPTPVTARAEITTEPALAPAPEEKTVVVETTVVPPAPAPAPVPPVKVGASFMTRYEARAGSIPVIGNRPLNSDALFYRARLSLTPAPIEFGHGYSSTVYFEPQASGRYLIGGDPLQDIDLNLHQGYLRVMAPCYTLDVGRFEMIYGDHLMIGNVGWNETGRAFNGGRLHIAASADSAWLDLFATLNHDGVDPEILQDDPHIGALDHYLVGAYAGLGPMIGIELDLYLLTKIWTGGSAVGASDPMAGTPAPVNAIDPAAQMTFGGRIKGDAGAVDYRAEAGLQFGARKPNNSPVAQPVSVFAYQADAELGVKPVKSVRLAAHGFIASGDDPTTDTNEAWDQHYPTAHKFLGLTDVFGGRSNVFGGAVHASLAFSESLKASADGHMFFRPEPNGAEDLAGSEVDVGLAYAISPALSLRGLYGVYLPNENGLVTNNPFMGPPTDQPQHFVEVELLQTMK